MPKASHDLDAPDVFATIFPALEEALCGGPAEIVENMWATWHAAGIVRESHRGGQSCSRIRFLPCKIVQNEE